MFLWIPLLLHHYLHVTMKPNNPVKNVFQCVSYINSVKCIYLKYMLLVSNASFFQGLQRSCCEEIAWWCLTLLFVCHTASRGKERTQCCERGPYAEEVRHQVWDTYKWIRDPPRRLTAGKASKYFELIVMFISNSSNTFIDVTHKPECGHLLFISMVAAYLLYRHEMVSIYASDSWLE